MKIDSHQHFWKYNETEYGWMGAGMERLKRDHLPGELAGLLKANGIKGTIAVQARQSIEESRWLLNLADENDFMKGVVGWVDLRSDGLELQLEEFAEHKEFVGVRHVVHDEPDNEFMLREDFQAGIGKLKNYDLTYDILIFPKHIKCAEKLVRKFDEQRFVVDHIAKPFIKDRVIEPWRTEMAKLAECGNVYCKVSGMVTEALWDGCKKEDFVPYMEAVLEIFGPNRVMFGSDWPVCTVAAEYEQVVGIVEDFISGLSSSEQVRVMGGTAVEFYSLRSLHE
jgi:L-fuconolactonase